MLIGNKDAFTLYHISNEETSRKKAVGPALPALGHATSGAAGTAISKLLLYPLDLVITRLQVQSHSEEQDVEYKGVQDAVQKIYRTEGGIHAFYRGILPETLKGVADSFLFFLAYTYIGQKRRAAQGSQRLSAIDEICVGVGAGAFAKLFTNPIQCIVSRKQTAAMMASRDPLASAPPDLSVKDHALQIMHEKGLLGFWSGYSASLILSLNPSITLLLQKALLRFFVSKERRTDPGALVTFLLAAVSKAIASTITYPFSLAKTRAQVSRQKPSQRAGPTSETEKVDDADKARIARARQHTVFSTILRIAKTEGLSALYQGLGAEVLKGFFSHGLTMLMKDRIHTVIIDLYYLILKSLKRYPGPEDLGKMATERAKDAYEHSKEHVDDAYAKGVAATGIASSKIRDAMAGGSHRAEELVKKGRQAAGSMAQPVKDKLED